MRYLSFIRNLALVVGLLGASVGFAEPDTVNINTADAATLAAVLKGVGQSKAAAIVEYREANGRFNDPYELTYVSGIGDATVEKNEERIVIQNDD